MDYSLERFFPGLGRDFFIHPDHVNAKGGAEKYVPKLGSMVYVPASCINAMGGAEKYLPGLGKQFFINPAHVQGSVVLSLSQAAPVSAKVTITASASGGVAPYATKYLSGTKAVADFASAGTSFTGSFDVVANGAYTVYAVDALGNTALKTITISTLS